MTEALAALELPPLTRRLLDLLGPVALIALAQEYGGTRCYVPQTVAPGHALAVCCGLEPARRLSAEFPGETLTVPMLSSFLRALRNAAIRGAWATNSAREIAQYFGITERSVFRIVGADDGGDQMDMFER